jgi:hypothetical protein
MKRLIGLLIILALACPVFPQALPKASPTPAVQPSAPATSGSCSTGYYRNVSGACVHRPVRTQNNAVPAVLIASSETPQAGKVIESYIEREFEGWSGDTLFKLDNGQIWQQDSYAYAYTYHYAYHPKMMIYKDGTRFKMKVEGVEDSIAVKRLK